MLVQASFLTITLQPVHAVSPPLQFSDFASMVLPTGVAYSQALDKLLISSGQSQGIIYRGLFQADSSGNLALFAPALNHTDEAYLAVSPGLGGFANGTIFAGTGPTNAIAKISPDGGSVIQSWTTCPGAGTYGSGGGAYRGGLTFDTTGSFANNLLALSSNGILFRVDSTGTCSTVANLAGHVSTGSCCSLTEGVTVAPLSFGPFGGDALVGSVGQVTAVSPSGTISALISLGSGLEIENLNFVPSTQQSFFVGMLIGDNVSDRVRIAPTSQFSSSDTGTLIASQEYPFAGSNQGNIYQVKFNSTSSIFTQTTIASGLTDMEGATFAPFLLPPQFSLGESGDITVSPGGSGSNTIAVSLGAGPSQPVSLSCSSGLPSGSSCAFNPMSGFPTYYSTMTVSTSSSTPTGLYVVNVTGIGGQAHTTQFTLIVIAQSFDFSISNSGGITLGQGGSGSNTIALTLASGSSLVSLSVTSGLPSGTSSVFNPVSASPTFSSTLTITTSSSTPTGSFPIVVTGSGGGQSHTTQFTLLVQPFDFSLSNSGSISVSPGFSGSNTITANFVSGSESVALSCTSGLPAGASCAFNPSTGIPSFSSALTISTLSSTPIGSYTINVTGSAGGATHSTLFTLSVAVFDFSISNSGGITMGQGSAGSNTIAVALVSGTTQSVSLSCASGLPPGASCGFSAISGTPPFSSTLTVTTLSSTPAGSYSVTISGTGGGQTRTTQFTLIVQVFDFSISNSGGITVGPGGRGTSTISVTLVSGTSQSVGLSLTSGLPSGASSMFNPGSGSPTFSSTLTIVTSSSTPTGSYTIIITGSGGGQSHTTQFTLNVSPGGPIGGSELPVNKLKVAAPYIVLAVFLLIGATVAALYVSRAGRSRLARIAN